MGAKHRPKPPAKRGPKPVTVSMYPLTPEQALTAFMQVDPKRVLAAEKRALRRREKKRGRIE